MAHKHNRRRGRPRSRRNQNRNNSQCSDSSCHSYSSGYSYESLTLAPQFLHSTPPSAPFAIPVGGIQAIPDFIPGAGHWRGRTVQSPEYYRQPSRPKYESPEAKRIRVFGGVPSDDLDLCDKMMEVFEGMAWID